MKFPIAALVFAVLAAGCAGPDVRGPFRNQYIDAETGKPIEGVVFLAVWESVTPTLTGDGGRRFYEAQEAVSDVDGRVELPGLVGPILRPMLNVRFHAFAAGHDYATDSPRITPSNGRPYVDPTVTLLRAVTSANERCTAVHRPSAVPSIPADEEAPTYMAALIREMELLRCGSNNPEQSR
jgi:hypothetical protein